MFSFVGAFLAKYFSGCTTSDGIWHRGFDTVWNTLAEDFFLLQKLFIMVFDIWNYIIPPDKLMQKIWWCSCAATQDKGSGVGNSRRTPKRPPRQIFPISNPRSTQDDFIQFFLLQIPLILFSRLTAAVWRGIRSISSQMRAHKLFHF